MIQFRAISMDPPWLEHGGGNRGAQVHYDILHTSEIAKLILRAECFNPAPDSHLWMWVTNNYLVDGISLMDRLGFRYVTNAAWVKTTGDAPGALYCDCECCAAIDAEPEAMNERTQIGLGQYMRGAHELLLFGTRGNAMVPAPVDRLPSVIFAPRTKHSEKPQEAYNLIERCSPGPHLEMFARAPRNGWTVWGNEVGPRPGDRP